jgi:endonuclease YncB( thermonuclease family)
MALACVLAVLPVAFARAEKTSCAPEVIGAATVRTVADGRTLTLNDGREVRLAGIEVPTGDAARAALAGAVAGQTVTLARLGPAFDRYGRRLALLSRPGQPPVQLVLLRQGLARVAARVGDAGCARRFLQAEGAARAARLGVWSDPAYVIQKADNPAAIAARRGRFTLVEGRVVSVRRSGGTVYVNFSERWSDDFTVTVQRRNERRFAAAGLDLKNMTGRHVRVRGTVEERSGPWIEAFFPEQIEIAERD